MCIFRIDQRRTRYSQVISIALAFGIAFAAADSAIGKSLFNDPKAFGGEKACNSCHPGGRGLEKVASKSEFHIMGKTQKSLEDAINFCIVNASNGKAIDIKSDKMMNLVAYIKSLSTAPGNGKASGY